MADKPIHLPSDQQRPFTEKIVAGHYVVALIDIMGQSDELAKWNYTPDRENPQPDWMRALENTRQRVLGWREHFDSHFRKTMDRVNQQAEAHRKDMPASRHKQFDQVRQYEILSSHFADSIILFSPLQNKYGYLQTANIYSMLGTLGTLFLIALAERTVFRGAIEVGMLCNLPTGEPYGPAMADVHRLESKCADYPRILVGPGARRYVSQICQNTATDAPTKAIRSIAECCNNFLSYDEDGQCIVDYLGAGFARLASKPGCMEDVRQRASEFVKSELTRFRMAGNKKLVARYERLGAYFRSKGLV